MLSASEGPAGCSWPAGAPSPARGLVAAPSGNAADAVSSIPLPGRSANAVCIALLSEGDPPASTLALLLCGDGSSMGGLPSSPVPEGGASESAALLRRRRLRTTITAAAASARAATTPAATPPATAAVPVPPPPPLLVLSPAPLGPETGEPSGAGTAGGEGEAVAGCARGEGEAGGSASGSACSPVMRTCTGASAGVPPSSLPAIMVRACSCEVRRTPPSAGAQPGHATLPRRCHRSLTPAPRGVVPP